MPLSWNEIRSNAIAFANEFAGETRENAEAKTFWDQFFKVFGLNRRHLASFEEPVKKLSGKYGFIDLFWKKTLLAEHKSAGKDLGKATSQAFDYVQSLIREKREDEVPRYLIVSDFVDMVLHDLDENTSRQFKVAKLHEHVDLFGFIPGYKQHDLTPQDPINIEAVRIMGDLHDALEAGGYSGHELERLLVRVLFCLFAENTGIFDRNAFLMYLEDHTSPDGSDTGAALIQFFQVLNTPKGKRQTNLREELAALPYVNGELFSEFLGFPAFNRNMRNSLLAATQFDWSKISPAVFGALFQSVMEPRERRQIGAHYTSERDILKLIGPLFLDDLKQTLKKAGSDKNKLRKLHNHLASLKILDPACGCGNFLVVAYRELRLLELDILKRQRTAQTVFDIETLSKVDVDQVFGIEIEEWPARIAEVAMWLMDHQMNLRVSEEFGEYFVRLPLKKSPHIHHGNALSLDWNHVLKSKECSFILGNPPFVGSKLLSQEQKADLRAVIGEKTRGVGLLDYVTAWYFKSAHYIQNTNISVAFVSTNSITQGEQVVALWTELCKLSISILFAHRPFAWQSEARGAAHVHVVIIGFATKRLGKPRIFEYEHPKGSPTELSVGNISPYLLDTPTILVNARRTPLCRCNSLWNGSIPADGGNLILDDSEFEELVQSEPEVTPFLRPYVGAAGFIHNDYRWCLWLKGISPNQLRKMPSVLKRVEGVKKMRQASKKKATREKSLTPTLFTEDRQPETGMYLAIPRTSSEARRYVPIGFLPTKIIAANDLQIVPDASTFEFGVITSHMHNAWLRVTSGRLESRYRYSAKMTYNTFPWPQDITDKQRVAVEAAAQKVLDAREKFPDATLADLYDPLSMPAVLTKAHAKLDRAVDRCYRSQPFAHERNRVEFLFELYERLSTPLVTSGKRKK